MNTMKGQDTKRQSVKLMKQDEIMQNFVIMLSDKKLETVKKFRKPGKIAIVKKHDKMYIPEKRKKLVGCDIDLEATVKLVITGNIANSEMHTQTNIHSKELQKKQDTLRLLEEQKLSGTFDESTDILINRLNIEINTILDIQVEHFDITFYRSVCKRVLEGLSDREKGWPYYNKLQIVYDTFREKLKPKPVKHATSHNNSNRSNDWRQSSDTNTGVTNNDVYVPPCARKPVQYAGNNGTRNNYRRNEGDGGNYRRNEGDGGNYRRNEGDGGNYRRNEGDGGNYRRNDSGGGNYRRNEGGGGSYRRNEGGGGNYRRNDGDYNNRNYNKTEDRSRNMQVRHVQHEPIEETAQSSDGFQSLSHIIKMKDLASNESFPSIGDKPDILTDKKTVWNTGNTVKIIQETVKKPDPTPIQVTHTILEPLGIKSMSSNTNASCYDEYTREHTDDNEWEQYIGCSEDSDSNDNNEPSTCVKNTNAGTNYEDGLTALTSSWADED